ncbi:Hypothetical predicted protein [Paramuricea clavata]|uniref:Uncharacterized protein n=1 Tax=Paramuricea clavata TaxID=317549 RepID=A0A7D9LDJ2_PARCT|nr:Hypothetical predicted protein [Paramuricea clavata]
MLAVVESITGPQREVVSIYNDVFDTPPSRPQYFIEVYRCVKVDFGECTSSGPSGYPVPENIEKIEIVVPHITNCKDQNSTYKTKFYKYVVYNHTSCKCGTIKFRHSTLYQTITNNEVEARKLNKLKTELNKAAYLGWKTTRSWNALKQSRTGEDLSQIRYCSASLPEHDCPKRPEKFSVALKNNTSTDQITLINNKVTFVNLTSDISCKANDGKNAEPQLCPNPTTQNSSNPITQNIMPRHGKLLRSSEDGNPRDKKSNHEILVSIASGKAILVAFLLALLLFTILIMDLTLCRRRKGILYALLGCKSDDGDNFCRRCSERNRKEITV